MGRASMSSDVQTSSAGADGRRHGICAVKSDSREVEGTRLHG